MADLYEIINNVFLLLFICNVLLYSSQSDQAVAPLQQPAGCQVPLVLFLQTGVLRAQVGHLLLQLLYPSSLPLQQLLLGIYDLVKLRQIFHSPGRVLGWAFHVAPSPLFPLFPPVVTQRWFSVVQAGFKRNKSVGCAFYASPLF